MVLSTNSGDSMSRLIPSGRVLFESKAYKPPQPHPISSKISMLNKLTISPVIDCNNIDFGLIINYARRGEYY